MKNEQTCSSLSKVDQLVLVEYHALTFFLLTDEGHVDEQIAQMLHVGRAIVERIRKKCVEN